MSKKVVVALGGNALGNNAKQQQEKLALAVKPIVDLISKGHNVVVTHGNGPQVGAINLAFSEAAKNNSKIPVMPLPECIAMSQGYIGYHIESQIKRELYKRNISREVVSVITEVVVDKNDEAFSNPVKPIGGYYSKEEIEKLCKENDKIKYSEYEGRGYRQVVASPMPIDIVEKDSITDLIQKQIIVITCGGGGIPVAMEKEGIYEGVDAVIDKDFASARLADIINADSFFIFTEADKVYLNFGKPNQKGIDVLTVEQAKKYRSDGHFAPGSMKPKIDAAIKFVEGGKNRQAIICSLENASEAISGNGGTKIYM